MKSATEHKCIRALKWNVKTSCGFETMSYGTTVRSHFRELGDHRGIACNNQGLSEIQEVKSEDMCA